MPLLAVLANRRSRPRRYNRNMIAPMIAGGIAAGVSGAVANKLLSNPSKSVRAYPVPQGYEAKVASTLRDLYVWAKAQDGQVLTIAQPGIVKKVVRYVLGGKVRRNPEGFYVMGKETSVAWCATRTEAEGVAKRLNYRGGTHYTVVAAGPAGTTGRIAAMHRASKNPLTRREAARGLVSARGDYRLGMDYKQGSPRRKFLLGRASGKAAMVADHGQGQRTRYIAASLETKAYARQNGAEAAITIPFKVGRKYSVESIAKWVEANGTPAMKKRFAQAVAQYKRFHKGHMPDYITYQPYKMGSHPGISDVEFGVSEGREWMAAYQVPRSSGKWVDKASAGRYVHAHGDSEIDVDVKKPVGLKKLPMRFHTPDGKSVGVIPSRNVKIGEWYEG